MQNDVDFFRKEYHRQKKLEAIIGSRELVRPKTKKWQVIVAFAFFAVLMLGLVISFVVMAMPTRCKILLIFLEFALVAELYLRFCLILTVKCYQHYANEEIRRRCLCIPSCSEYAIICLTRYPLLAALVKIRKRLYKTCKGEDYKLNFPCKRMNVNFEKSKLS